MAFIPPKFQPSSKGGMLFVNPPGVANFRALRVESGDQHLYWQPTYQHILRVEGAFGEFFPQAEFSDNGNQVIFTKYVDQAEVLCRTRALRPGERIPRGEWQRFLETWTNFKRLADRSDIPEDVRNFICKFGPPSVERYPAAYRIFRPHWYSKSRLFILWGLEPVGGADFISVSPEQAISEGTARAETDGEETSGDFLRWLKIFLFGLLALAALLFLFWCFLPRPIVDFEVTAEAEQPATTKNLTRIDQDWDWGVQDYRWSFAEGQPDTSTEFEPKPVWQMSGPHEVTLEATRSTLWGLLYKTDAKTIAITVAEKPKPPVVITPPLVPLPALPPLTTPPGEVNPPGKMSPAIPVPLVPKSESEVEKGPEFTNPNRKMLPGDKTKPGDTMILVPKPDGEPAPVPGQMSPDGKMTPDRKLMPGEPNPFVPKPDSEGGKEPGTAGPNGKMTPGEEKAMGPKLDGAAEKGTILVVPDGKMTPDGKSIPREPKPLDPKSESETGNGQVPPGKMTPGEPNSSVPKSESEANPPKEPKERNGRMTPDGKLIPLLPGRPQPAPRSPAPTPPSQVLPVPQVVIADVTPLADGKSQDIDFSLNLPKGVQLEHLEVDGKEVKVPPNGAFRLRLPIGRHSLRIEYGSTSSDLHGEVTQDLDVDADQVKVIKPKTSIAPPVKVPGSDQPLPTVPTKPRDEAAEKFDKKTA
jgi:hypothetical protein